MSSVTITEEDAPTATKFDGILADLLPQPDIALHLEGRQFQTRGVYRWGQFASRNLGKNWTVDGDAEISIVSPVEDNQPLFCLAGPAHSVKGITVRGNHSLLSKGWQGSLRTGGVLLDGKGLLDRVTFKDCGAKRAPGQPASISSETFVAEILGGGGITNCTFTEHDLKTTDDQVSVFRNMASDNGSFMLDEPCLHEGNTTHAPGSKWVQAHCIYGMPGVVTKNKHVGGFSLYYGDFYGTKGVDILLNKGEDLVHGVVLKLAPTAGTDLEMPKYFFHEDYDIGPNKFQTSGANVLLDPMGPQTATRYIRGIKVDASLSLLDRGAIGTTRTGVERASRKGCNPFQ